METMFERMSKPTRPMTPVEQIRALVEALKPFAECCESIGRDESDEEWAKFRLLIKDYRRAFTALSSCDIEQIVAGLEGDRYAWLIEAPGTMYLAPRKVGLMYDFYWTDDHNKALRFQSEEVADLTMMAIRGLAPDLFGFAKTLGDARAVEHGWIAALSQQEQNPCQ